MATIVAQPTDAPTAVVPTNTPLADTNPDTPNDTTQARLRVTPCVFGGPHVDVIVNGTVVVNGGMPFSNIAPFYSTGYVYLPPGVYSVAVVPTGQDSAPALLDPVDVSVAAGHRYTLAVLGQAEDAQHTSLLIDETVAYQRAGAAPDRRGHITINNLRGAPGITFSINGVAGNDAPYGGFSADTWPAQNLESFAFTVSGAPDKVIDSGGPLVMYAYISPSVDVLDCWGGTYPGGYGTQGSPLTSTLDPIAFLERFHGRGLMAANGSVVSFDTLLAALKQTGLDKQLTTDGPHLLLAPTDAAFAALSQAQRAALLADPKSLADLLHAHIVEGYFPPGALASTPGGDIDRTVTNMLGEPLTLRGSDPLIVNGDNVASVTEITMVANGTRVMGISKLVVPAAK